MTSPPKTVYDAMLAEIEARIRDTQWPPGHCLPSESELCKAFSISRVSVRRALAKLQSRGLIQRMPGKGTYVADRSGGRQRAALRTLGLSVPTTKGFAPTGIFFGPVYQSILETCRELGCRLEMVHQDSIGALSPNAMAGVICISYHQERLPALIAQQPKVEIVLINRRPEDHPFHCVMIDDKVWAMKAMDYLIGLGHRNIALVGLHPMADFTQIRIEGCRQAMEDAGIPWNPARLVLTGDRATDSTALCRVIADRDITAVFMASGNVQMQVLAAMRELRRCVPEDLSVVVFDDIGNPFAPWIPPLTVVRQPLAELGSHAVRMLLRLASGELSGRGCEILPAELVVRESCRSIRTLVPAP